MWVPAVTGSPHLFILGIPGQGKSWTVTRILRALAAASVPALVFDFHGQFGDPDGAYARAAHLTVVNATQGLPFSPFEAAAGADAGTSYWKTNCFAVAEIFQHVCDLGDIQRDVFFEALAQCYRDCGFDEGRPDRLPTVGDLATRLAEHEQVRGVKNVLPRCRPLLEFGLFREDATAATTDLRGLLGNGLVIDVHHLGLETLQLAAGAFLLRYLRVAGGRRESAG